MRQLIAVAVLLFPFLISAQPDSIRKPGKVRMGVFTAASYQLAYNGETAETDLGNFGFRGYLQPEIGLALRYQSDSAEFALLTVSASRMVFTIANTNALLYNGSTYPIVNRIDIFMNNFGANVSYHKRFTHGKPNLYFSYEMGVGFHLFNLQSASISSDTAAGPYTITRVLDFRQGIFGLPSGELGLNFTHISMQTLTEFTFGLRGEVYLGKFPEIGYEANYTSPADSFGYTFKWAPAIITPKAYVLVVF